MIVDFFLNIILGAWSSALGALPDVGVPDGVKSSVAALESLTTAADTMGVWFPLGFAFTMANLILLSIVVQGSIKLFRITVSFFTAGGGNA